MKHNGLLRYGWGIAAMLLLFASCLQDGLPGDGDTLPEGKYPLELAVAAVDGMATRAATGKDAWTEGDEIGVRIEDGNLKVGRYRVNADGSRVEAVTPVYWMSGGLANVTAWWPYADQTNVSIANQSKGYAAYDFLTATAENQTYRTPVALNFKHQMAKVKYTLKAGTGITEADLATAQVVFNVYNMVSFTQGVLTYNPRYTDIKPFTTSATEGEALLPPQDWRGRSFISITINNKGNFTYTPKAGEDVGNFVAGMEYTYEITVKAYDIKVETVKSGTWSDGGNPVAITGGTVLVEYTADEVKPGDYIYTDGTISDGGLRARKLDGTAMWADTKPEPETGKTVSGIVFWTPKETDYTPGVRKTPARLTDDKIMAAEHPSCIRGLAVALKNGGTSSSSIYGWQYKNESVEDFRKSSMFNHDRKSDFVSIAPQKGVSGSINYVLGYQNTQVLLAYNAYCIENNRGDSLRVRPAAGIAGYEQRNPAPKGSTGWYLPSAKELHILFRKDIDDVTEIFEESNFKPQTTREIVDSSITAAKGDKLAQNSYPAYYSSTEDYSSPESQVYAFNNRLDKVEWRVKNDKDRRGRVRLVCAF